MGKNLKFGGACGELSFVFRVRWLFLLIFRDGGNFGGGKKFQNFFWGGIFPLERGKKHSSKDDVIFLKIQKYLVCISSHISKKTFHYTRVIQDPQSTKNLIGVFFLWDEKNRNYNDNWPTKKSGKIRQFFFVLFIYVFTWIYFSQRPNMYKPQLCKF